MKNKNIEEYFEELIEDLKDTEYEEKIETLIEYGNKLELFPEEEKKDENIVKGCISNVFLLAYQDKEGLVYFKAHSDALVIKGYLGLLVEGLSGHSKEEILNSTPIIEHFAKETDVKASLSLNQVNAFGNIYSLMLEKVKKL